MSSIDGLAIVREISSSPELAGRLIAVQTYFRQGCMIDWYRFQVNLDGQEIGAVHVCNAVTLLKQFTEEKTRKTLKRT